MKNLDDLTDEELRELLSQPLSEEEEKEFREIERADGWLLALSLREMECEETEPDDEKEVNSEEI